MIPLIKCAIYLKCKVTYKPVWPAMVAPILFYFFISSFHISLLRYCITFSLCLRRCHYNKTTYLLCVYSVSWCNKLKRGGMFRVDEGDLWFRLHIIYLRLSGSSVCSKYFAGNWAIQSKLEKRILVILLMLSIFFWWFVNEIFACVCTFKYWTNYI